MHSAKLPLHKRRRVAPQSDDDSSATPQTIIRNSIPPKTSAFRVPYTEVRTSVFNQVSDQLTYPPPASQSMLNGTQTPPLDLLPCLPHLTSPYPAPTPPNMAVATPEERADYNMEYLRWRRLDQQWRVERFVQLAAFLSTWRETMIAMALICYEGRYWAMREMGVQIGVLPQESRESLRRRMEVADEREETLQMEEWIAEVMRRRRIASEEMARKWY